MPPNPNDWNQKIIEEFRANEGRVGGQFDGFAMVLVHHTGARSGTERVTPLAYLPDGDRVVVFAAKAGAPTNPDWYHNLKAHPQTTIEVGAETRPVEAVEVTGVERDELYARMTAIMPGFAEYQTKTSRMIPVIAFAPAG